MILTLVLSAAGAEETGLEPFDFVALGDTAYNGEPDYPHYEALIDLVNSVEPAFSVHVGDIWGAGTCADWHIERIAGFFKRFDHPLVYTPGDNEWTDCGNPGMGGFDTVERLQKLRQTFFLSDRTLGARPMTVIRQSDVSTFKAYVENARWEKSGVLFVTAHVVGSHNHAFPASWTALAEFHERNKANVAWLNDSFRIAREEGHRAVVVVIHAELFASDDSPLGPFGDTIRAIRSGATRFERPVLLIHGDAHRFIVDRPFIEYLGEEEMPKRANITRLQVYGAPEIRAVRVRVEPETPWVFGFSPLYVR
jgi:hypothetical protein